MAKLYVVCGHGAGDPGAGGYGYSEAERVRTLAAEMKRQAGDQMILGDTSINWYASDMFSKINNPGIPVLELHMDSAGAGARGGHVIIDGDLQPDNQDNALAKFISGFFPGRSVILSRRNDLKNPNVCARRGINYRLMECGFISDRGDLDKFNANIGALASGILNVFGISTQAPQPTEPVREDPKYYPPAQVTGSSMKRVRNPHTGEHIYTTDTSESDKLVEMGWNLEGTAWGNNSDIRMIYRLYNPFSGYHMYTTSHGEACRMVDDGWKYEGIAGYANGTKTDTPVYRLFNQYADQHLFTTNPDEVKDLKEIGWNDEGVAFYV